MTLLDFCLLVVQTAHHDAVQKKGQSQMLIKAAQEYLGNATAI
jgi:hypothetical protein